MSLHPDLPNSSDLAKEREDFEDLLRSPGWQRFMAYVVENFQGLGYVQAMNAALSSQQPHRPHVVNETAKEVMRIVAYPLGRLQDLKGDTE